MTNLLLHFTLPATGEEYFLFLDVNWNICKADILLHVPWYAKHIFIYVDNKYVVSFDYRGFLIFINHFTTNPGIGKMCWVHFDKKCFAVKSRWGKNGSHARQYETWYISFDFYHHSSESLTLSCPVHIETLAMIYWNSCVAPTCQKEKSQLYKIIVVM